MNHFVEAMVARIKRIATSADLRSLYDWIWENQREVAETAEQINSALRLEGPFALQPDLPCLAVGSQSGLVVLAANPGWNAALNANEDAYCRRSRESYADMMFNFFEAHPRVVGKRITWWGRSMSLLSMLPDQSRRPGSSVSTSQRWRSAHEERLLGGWELFPWHSTSDGLTSQLARYPWLHEFFSESIQAALRLGPRVLFVASKVGWQLVRQDLLARLTWSDFILGSRIPVQASYARLASGSEVIAVARQLSAPRDFTNDELFANVRGLHARPGVGDA